MAYFAARRWFDRQDQTVDQAAASQFDQEHGYQLCALMLVEPDAAKPTRVLKDAGEARRELSPNEAEWFVEQHLQLQTAELRAWGARTSSDPYLAQVAEALDLDVTEVSAETIVKAVRILAQAARDVDAEAVRRLVEDEEPAE